MFGPLPPPPAPSFEERLVYALADVRLRFSLSAAFMFALTFCATAFGVR